MAVKIKSKGFIIGLIIGIIVSFAVLYYYENYYKKTKFERDAAKFEKNAKKELNKTGEKAKKLFD
jgi:H+/gluconate symporter-like permease